MNSEKLCHLNEAQIIQSIIDETDLSPELRRHLSFCSGCRSVKEELEQDFEKLKKTAEGHVPLPRKRVSLPAIKSRGFIPISAVRRVWLGTALAACLIIFAVIMGPMRQNGSLGEFETFPFEVWNTDAFMAEVNALAENALSDVYQDIICNPKIGTIEDFMKFVVPSVETDLISKKGEEQGVLS